MRDLRRIVRPVGVAVTRAEPRPGWREPQPGRTHMDSVVDAVLRATGSERP